MQPTVINIPLDAIFIGCVAIYLLYMLVTNYIHLPKFSFLKTHLSHNQPLLLAYYTLGNELTSLASGDSEGVSYKIYMTMGQINPHIKDNVMDSGAIIYMLELDFNTQAHIIGLGKQNAQEKQKLGSFFAEYHMDKISLEGDFDNYFSLYAAPGQQTTVRYIFDPAAMQNFIDYLGNNYWEIVGDEMYIVISRNNDQRTKIIHDGIAFIRSIRPAIVRTQEGEEPVHHETTYGIYKGPPLPCPLCKTNMVLEHNMHTCPNGHGLLLYGKELSLLHNKKISATTPSINTLSHGDLKCPNCKNTMIQSNYQFTKTVVDTCKKCAFRWLDADEVVKIQSKSRELL